MKLKHKIQIVGGVILLIIALVLLLFGNPPPEPERRFQEMMDVCYELYDPGTKFHKACVENATAVYMTVKATMEAEDGD